jgi:hypothetical protein
MKKRTYEQVSLRKRIEIYGLHADGKSLRCTAAFPGQSATASQP